MTTSQLHVSQPISPAPKASGLDEPELGSPELGILELGTPELGPAVTSPHDSDLSDAPAHHTNGSTPEAAKSSAPVDIPDLRLRPLPKPVVRLSRNAVSILAILVGLAIGTALVLGLKPPAAKTERTTADSNAGKTSMPSEKLAELPANYADVPRLGPPLPGDLGRPILAAQAEGKHVPNPAEGDHVKSDLAGSVSSSPTQASLQTRQAAITSALFGTHSASRDEESFTQNSQDQKASKGSRPTALLSESQTDVSKARLQAPASAFLLQAGSYVPAALITGLQSDLPGLVCAQVTEDVFDSLTGQYLLVPQGSRLIGRYDTNIGFGQSRILLVWTRLILPNGQSLSLDNEPASDKRGFSGLNDRVNYYWAGMFETGGLATILSIGAELGQNNNDTDIIKALRQGTQSTLDRAGQTLIDRQANIRPSLTVRPGFPVNLILTRDLVLAPYSL